MEVYREPIIIGSVAVYMIFCIAVGLWAMRRTQSADEFFVAGKSLGPIVISLAIFSSALSGFGFVGGPGLVYTTGFSSVWMTTGVVLGYGLTFFLVAKRIRMVAGVRKCISLPDIVQARYGDRTVSGLTALTIILGVMGYLATQILAMALVMQAILSQTDAFENIRLITCLIVSASVLVFYCVTGGIIASVYTDVVQGIIMSISGLLIFFTAANIFDGGFTEASQVIFADDAEAIMPFGTTGALTCLGWFFIFGVGLAGQPHLITKMMMNDRIEDNKVTFPVTLLSYTFAALLWGSIGLAMRAMAISGGIDPLTAGDAAAPTFLSLFAHPILAGIVFAGLFAAIMSTTDAFLNIGVAAIIHDLPKAIRGRPIENELTWARIMTVVLAIIATIFALYAHYVSETVVALLGAFGWSTFAAVIVPVVMIGLNWERAHPTAAIVAIIASLTINLGFQVFAIAPPGGLQSGHLAILTSLIAFIAISLFSSPPKLDDDIEAIMRI